MPVKQVIKEGNVTTEILDLRDGVGGHRSVDEILAMTGGSTGTYEEVGADGTKYTYSVEVEEVKVYDFSVWDNFLIYTSCLSSG